MDQWWDLVFFVEKDLIWIFERFLIHEPMAGLGFFGEKVYFWVFQIFLLLMSGTPDRINRVPR
jgi:hypothetical protein